MLVRWQTIPTDQNKSEGKYNMRQLLVETIQSFRDNPFHPYEEIVWMFTTANRWLSMHQTVMLVELMTDAFKEDKEAAANVGMQAHIAKPLDIEEMLKTLSWVLNASDN